MIIIHGGKNQGQDVFANELLKKMAERSGTADEGTESQEVLLCPDFYDKCRYCFDRGLDPYRELGLNNKNLILVTREIGSGIIPLDKSDREFREYYGRILLELAAEADEVYRVICGIPQRLK